MLKKRLLHILAILTLTSFVAACGSDDVEQTPSGDECETSDDCDDGEQCIDGECIEDEPVDDCDTDDDCDDGEQCIDGACIEDEPVDDCDTDDDCDDGEQCIDGACIEVECEDDTDCPDDHHCEDAQCVPATVACEIDDDCEDGQECVDGECEDVGPTIPPAGGSTICGAGGVSEGGGMRLTHCLAPYDQASQPLQGEEVRLQSGGFQVITD